MSPSPPRTWQSFGERQCSLSNILKSSFAKAMLGVLSLFFGQTLANADDATWNGNPISGDWNTPGNWTPAVVPTNIATFDASTVTDISVSKFLSYVDSLVFNPGASAYTITALSVTSLDIYGGGIINNSGIVQNFVVGVDQSDSGIIEFLGHAQAGNLATVRLIGGAVQFQQSGHAGHATFVTEGGTTFGLYTSFFDHSNADQGTFINNGGLVNGGDGGHTAFNDTSKATNAVITANGATVNGAYGGTTEFHDKSDAGNATLIANAGSNGGGGGQILLNDDSVADSARVEVFGNGTLDVAAHRPPGAVIGSLEGDGLSIIGSIPLSVGSSNLSTVFSGVIQDEPGGFIGLLTKVGTGTLTLSGHNSYTGGTTVSGGVLLVNRSGGSGTGAGPVAVNAGTLGGNGTITGAVTVGTGNGAGAFLEPSIGASKPTELTIQSPLSFKSDGTYTYKLNTRNARADQVIANGVSIESGAQFSFTAVANKKLTNGSVFTALSNTAATPIAGAFANLPDGSTFTAGRNKFEVSYEGGDGNDLTLTVVP